MHAIDPESANLRDPKVMVNVLDWIASHLGQKPEEASP